MDFLTETWKYVSNIPFLGKILGAIVVIFAINEIISKYTMQKINPLKSLFDFIPLYNSKKLKNKREKYYHILSTPDYLKWSKSILQRIYPEIKLTNILDFDYTVFCIPACENYKYPFSELLDLENLQIMLDEKYQINNPIQLNYKKILGNTIKRPLLKGYMLTQYKLDEKGCIITASAKTGTYEQNVYSSHILEYELFLLYKKNLKNIDKIPIDKILTLLPMRNSIHLNQTPINVLKSGVNRSCLFGVQIFVIFKAHDDNRYKVLVIKRSEDVAAKPGYFQFIPSGGFEIFQNYDDEFILRNNFSVKLALFRELVEEAYGEEDYVHNEKGVPEENILIHPKVGSLIEMIEKKEAFFEFLGSTVDLVTLRHELSFILRIDNINFSKSDFKPNHESKNIQLYPITELSKRLNKEKLNQGSAGLLYLASKNHLFKEICNEL